MKTKNEYPDIPENIVRLTRGAAGDMQRSGLFAPEDKEDHEQEIILYILKKTARISNIAELSEDDIRALIVTFIEHKKQELIRKQAFRSSRETYFPEIFDRLTDTSEHNTVLKMDMERACEKLTPQQKRVVSMLYHGFGVTDIAKKLHITPAAVNCYVRRMRKVFKGEGLDSYLQN
ncbi:MAG TPA: sigma factor-like helix-turn-helix DNA-binding protein [bacterium]|nr:sigma factor-like helix-turn-helix DNA-binding protein [bacterium]